MLNKASEEATIKKHGYLTIEHVFKQIIHSDFGKKLVKDTEVQERIELDLEEYFKYMEKSNDVPVKTEEFEMVLNNMMMNIEATGKTLMGIRDFLLEMNKIEEAHINSILKKNNISLEELLKRQKKSEEQEFINEISFEMVEAARQNSFGRGIGVDNEVEMLFQTLKRKNKANSVLVGEAGVGKTTIVEELAHRISDNTVPVFLKDAKIYSLNLGALVAGTKYRGDFEAKVTKLLDEIQKEDNSILFIDEIHMIMGAGSSSDSNVDVANLLKPYLSTSKIRVIGATTKEEYRQSFVKDKAISRRFTMMKVNEPSIEDTKKILLTTKPNYEKHHKVKYSDEVVEKAVELSSRYITNRFLPDKAIDIIDIAGSKVHLRNGKEVKMDDVIDVIENITKIKIADVKQDKSEKTKIRKLGDNLKSKIFGQEEVINQVTAAIAKQKIFKTTRPVSMLLAGATGTGKTEIVKQISDNLSMNLIRLDMSNYSEKHNVSNLVGSSSGLVGYEEGSPFLKEVQSNPYSIILLDEMEKAHPEVFNTFLPILDEGKMDDNKGEVVDFSNTIIVMTTNLGFGKSKMVAKKIGLTNKDTDKQKEENTNVLENVKSFFRPEFINRIDLITTTNRLSEKVIVDIVKKEITIAEEEMKELNIKLKVSATALKELAKAGFNEEYGARFIKRTVDKEVKEKITELYLLGEVDKDSVVSIGLKKGEYTFTSK